MIQRILASAAFVAASIGAIPAYGQTSVRADGQGSYPSLRIVGFSDFDFFASDEQIDGATSGFHEGQFVLHFASALSSRFSFFAETSFTAARSEFKTEVERSILKFVANDALKLSAGRYHTPINWWNTAYHHGQWLQTTVGRPEMIRFGGVFMPVHFVGIQAEGTAPLGALNVLYGAGAGNGRSSNPARGGDADDVNNNKAWIVNLGLRPDRFYSLQVGGAFYRDRIRLDGQPEERESIASGYVVWMRENPELLGEFAFVRHENAETGTHEDNQAWYVQAAYRLPLWQSRVKPYGRYERLDISISDAVFLDLIASQEIWTFGLRQDVSDFVALKEEYRLVQAKGVEDVNAIFFQASFTF